MQYKRNSKDVFARLTELYTGKGADKIFAKMKVANPIFDEFITNYYDGEVGFPSVEERIAYWDKALSIYTDVEDDYIPNCYIAEFDEGLYTALFGADIKFMQFASGWISSMVVPFVTDLDEVKNFKLDENNKWFKLYKSQMSSYCGKVKNKYGISHIMSIDGLNFLYELMGATQTYYELFDNPCKVKYVIDFSTDLNIWLQDTFFKIVGLLNGGTPSIYASWCPGKIVNESVDPFHLTSVQMFEEWGREPVEKLFSRFDGGVIHLHSNGRHLLERVARIKGVKCIYIGDEDFNPPHAYEMLEELSSKRGTVPVVISVPFDIFVNKLSNKELVTNVLYDVTGVPDVSVANRLMEHVREYKL